MILRLVAIIAIFICTSVAWLILGGTLQSRTNSAQQRLGPRLESVWGTSQSQAAPFFTYEEQVPEQYEEKENGKRKTVTTMKMVPHTLSVSTTRAKVQLTLQPRRKGLLWYSTYVVDFAADYSLDPPPGQPQNLRFVLPLPAQRAIYDDLGIACNGQPLRVGTAEGIAFADPTTQPGQPISCTAHYKSQGVTEWSYEPVKKVDQISNFQLQVQTNFADIEFADNTLAPSRKTKSGDGWLLEWNYKNLMTGSQIRLPMPEMLQPGPLASEIAFFAPVALFFFFFLMFLITTTRGIALHPMNYFFLAAAFFAFHLLLAYLVDHLELHTSFFIAAAVSLFLVVSYLRLVAGATFAFREAALAQFVYLILFSYAFFFRGFTGLAITIGTIVTLFVVMQATAKVDWQQRFAKETLPFPSLNK